MNKSVLGMLLLFTLGVLGDQLDIRTVTVDEDNGVTVSSVSPALTDAVTTSFVMPAAGSALVISTFSSEINKNPGGDGYFQLTVGGIPSLTLRRAHSGNNDTGIGSVVNIFEGLSSGANSATLQASVSGQSMTLFGVNNVVIPLVTDDFHTLNYDIVKIITDITSVGTTFTEVAKGNIAVNLTTGNDLYIATALSVSASAEITGEWRLEYAVANSGNWTPIGKSIERKISSSTDVGIVTLYGAVKDLDSGNYDVRLVSKSPSAIVEVDSSNATLAIVSLSYNDGESDQFFPLVSTSADGGVYNGTSFVTIPQATIPVTLDAPSDIFVSMNFGGFASTGANQNGQFDIALMSGITVVKTNQLNQRFFKDNADLGSGASVGLLSSVSAGTYTIDGRHDIINGATSTINVNLIAFQTESEVYIYTPAVGLEASVCEDILSFSVQDEIGVKEYQVFDNETGTLIDTIVAGSGEYELQLSNGLTDVIIKAVDYSGFSQSFIPTDGNIVKVLYDLSEGWNLIAMPGEDADLTAINSAVGGNCWKWTGSNYEISEIPRAGEAIWVNSPANITVIIPAKKVEVEFNLQTGWNLVGPTKNLTIPENIISVYTWEQGAYKSILNDELLLQGIGYWLFSL